MWSHDPSKVLYRVIIWNYEGQEVDELPLDGPLWTAHCVKHPASMNCQASLPSCTREYIKCELPKAGFYNEDETSWAVRQQLKAIGS